jgi:hypothetical protein
MSARVDGAYASPAVKQERQARVDGAYASPAVKQERQARVDGAYVSVMVPLPQIKRRPAVFFPQ